MESITSQSDFISDTWTMMVLSAGTDEVTSISGLTITGITTQSTGTPSFTAQAITY